MLRRFCQPALTASSPGFKKSLFWFCWKRDFAFSFYFPDLHYTPLSIFVVPGPFPSSQPSQPSSQRPSNQSQRHDCNNNDTTNNITSWSDQVNHFTWRWSQQRWFSNRPLGDLLSLHSFKLCWTLSRIKNQCTTLSWGYVWFCYSVGVLLDQTKLQSGKLFLCISVQNYQSNQSLSNKVIVHLLWLAGCLSGF